MSSVVKEVDYCGTSVRFEFNKYAKQANGSVMVTAGGTQILVTVCNSDEDGQGFFPLTVDYIEKFYAVGRIPGGFIKRETRPSARETLTARVIDRPLRPSFPKEYMKSTHVVCTIMSYDGTNDPEPLALMGASTALMISDIPFNGPVVALRMGMKNGEFIFNPARDETDLDLNLNIAANPDAVLMVEAGANFLSEEKMVEAITRAHEAMKPAFEFQIAMQKEIGKAKMELEAKEVDAGLYAEVKGFTGKLKDVFNIRVKQDRSKALKVLKKEIVAQLNPEGDEAKSAEISGAYEKLNYETMRSMILDDKVRIDGRGYADIRPISCETGNLIRSHGSALFTRGETQSLCSLTLGSGDDEQRLDSIYSSTDTKRFMLHYNFPPYSVGESRPLRAPGRREIGHGNLAETAISYVLPPKEQFNYTIRLVSEVLESNGSSSMASICSGTLALLDGGVPLKEPVSGIAMGLILEGDRYAVLSDILGDEDHLGDMDFKVAGGKSGITALQMDIKISGLSKEILQEALQQAKVGRQHILDKLNDEIATPRDISKYAPRIFQIKISPDKIKDLIGPGGKTIKSIIADCGVKIDVAENGMVDIVAPTSEAAENAKKVVRNVVSDPEVGTIYLGKVKKIMDFGAFVEIKPGIEGLVHISQLEDRRVDKVTDIVREGEDVLVKVIDVDRQGKIKLSRKDALGKKPTQ